MSSQSPQSVESPFGRYDGQPLWYRDSDHSYWHGAVNATRLFSVTEILVSAGLINTRYFSDAAAERGTFVHQATEYHDREDMTLNEEELDEKIRPYMEAYKKFTLECQPKWTHIEHRVGDPPLRIAGTIDRVGSLKLTGKARHKVVLDIKSGGAAPSHAIQLAAYSHFATRELLNAGAAQSASPTKPLVQRYALYLTSKGTYSLKRFTKTTDIAVFMGARAVCLWREEHGLN
jgi:hypothetical protein